MLSLVAPMLAVVTPGVALADDPVPFSQSEMVTEIELAVAALEPLEEEPDVVAVEQEPAPPPPEDAPSEAPQTFSVDWDELARCESGYGGEPNWSINTGNSFYGGLQFNKESWDWAVEVGGHNVPAWPHEATREQQIAVAETLLEIHPRGLGAWPACTRSLGWR